MSDDRHHKYLALNKTKDVNFNVFDMITEINESKTLMKHISCNFRCKSDGRKCNVN